MNLTTELNYDCLYQIFSFLGPREWLVCSNVNRKWRNAAEFVWKDNFKLDYATKSDCAIVKNRDKYITLREIVVILRRIGDKLREVSLLIDDDYCENSHIVVCHFGDRRYCIPNKFKLKNIIKVLSNVCENIITLRVKIIHPKDHPIWQSLFQRNADLKSFKLSSADYERENKKFLLNLSDSLDKIKLPFFYIYSDEYEKLFKKQVQLSHIHISAREFTDNVFRSIAKHEQTLKSLCLHRIPVPISRAPKKIPTLKRETLLEITKYVNLEKLHISGFWGLTDDIISQILKHCQKIREVKLGRQKLPQQVLEAIAPIPQLEKLNFNELKLIVELSFPVQMECLKEFTLYLPFRTDFNFPSVTQALKKMPVLSRLTIGNVFDERKEFFDIINIILARNKYILIKPIDDRHLSRNDISDLCIDHIRQIEIYKGSVIPRSKNLRFVLTINEIIFKDFIMMYQCGLYSDLTSNYSVFKRECGNSELTLILPNLMAKRSSSPASPAFSLNGEFASDYSDNDENVEPDSD